ncbi:MAG: NIPSNAP family protein [Alphaproteobacteria bacterium]|nr:NIPSNAP family protein [Alphaproteobacteria bacterium]
MKPAPFFPIQNSKPGPIGILDVRTYTVKHGATADFLKAYAENGLPVQQKHLGHNVGYFVSDIGPLNQVLHIWAYPSVEERARRRQAMNEDPQWPVYLERGTALLQSMENSLMVPAPFWQPNG